MGLLAQALWALVGGVILDLHPLATLVRPCLRICLYLLILGLHSIVDHPCRRIMSLCPDLRTLLTLVAQGIDQHLVVIVMDGCRVERKIAVIMNKRYVSVNH